MNMQRNHAQPVLILALVATIVLLFWLLVSAHAGGGRVAATSNGAQAVEHSWKLVTSWPKNFPGLGSAADRFAHNVNVMSGGRMQVKVFAGGELVPALGVFDAVSRGTAEAGHSAAYYWKGKVPAAIFFTAVPFGMTAQEQNGWLHYGGGMELWREVYGAYNLVPLAAGNTGVQMAGAFNVEINSIEDLRGLKMRIPGVGGEVFNRAGGSAVTLPGGELYTSLQTGVIDAAEFVAAYNDRALGLHEVTRYYYFPGWHEPGPTLELVVNKDAYEALPEDLRTIVDVAARDANADMLDLYTAYNQSALQQLKDSGAVEVRELPDDVLVALRRHSQAYLEDLIANDPVAAKVYASWKPFADGAKLYHRTAEKAFMRARDLPAD